MANDHGELARKIGIVHFALRRSLASIVEVSGSALADTDRAPFSDYVTRFLDFLHSHHHGEDEFLFPGLLKAFARTEGAAAREATQAIRARQGEHATVIASMTAMREQVAGLGAGSAKALGDLHDAASKLQDLLTPHLDGEEKDIGGAVLEPLMSVDEVTSLGNGLLTYEKKHGTPKVLMLFIHSLDGPEQVELFGDLPWIVRRVLVRWIWSRSYRPLLKFSHAQASAL